MRRRVLNYCTLCLLFVLFNYTSCLEREMTVNIDPRKEDCFYQSVSAGEVIEFEYQVIDGGHGDLDITFHLVDPTGRILVSDYKKSESSHRAEGKIAGDYRFCFDNTFSSYNTKTVFFELLIEGENSNSEWDSEENIEGLRPDEVYELKIQDVTDALKGVHDQLNKAQHIQLLLKSIGAKDRNVVEESFFKVNTFSMVQIVIMILVGIIQVVMVRSLFDDNSKVHKLLKSLHF